MHGPVLAAAGLADREDSFDEAVALGGLGAGARLAPQDGVTDRSLRTVIRGIDVGVRGKVARQMRDAYLAAGGVKHRVHAVTIGNEDPVEVAEQILSDRSRAGLVNDKARRGR